MPMLDGSFYYAEELASSNDTAAELIQCGAGSGTLVLAESQTKGRGRGGNAWSCPKGEGLLFSLVIEPDFDRKYWSRIALAAGLSVVEAVRKLGVAAQIKWPNDVWIDGRKCAGVLVEGCESQVIVGIGLNVSVSSFPEEIEHSATSLYKEGIAMVNREALLADIVRGVFKWGSLCGAHFESVVEQVNAHCALRGEMIQLRREAKVLFGMMAGVDPQGHLLLEQNGIIDPIAQADEVRKLQI